MSLPAEVRVQYVAIIDGILDGADLSTISAKRVRNGIQEKVQYDITPHKAAINDLIGERFDLANSKQNGDGPPVPSVEPSEPPAHTNGVHVPRIRSPTTQSLTTATDKRDASSADLSEVVNNAPPKKKRKPSVDDDAAIAARLQAEEDKLARPTRGGTTRKAAPAKKKKTPKKKTHARVTGSDDSDIDDEDHKDQKPKRDTGFHKPLNLSIPLSNLFDGETRMSRPQVTKRLWQYIKKHDLQEPTDKRFIRCDDRLREIFRQDRVHMFTMTKLVSQQMYNPEE